MPYISRSIWKRLPVFRRHIPVSVTVEMFGRGFGISLRLP